VIRLTVMMSIRYPPSSRQLEDLLSERGIDIRHETAHSNHFPSGPKAGFLPHYYFLGGEAHGSVRAFAPQSGRSDRILPLEIAYHVQGRGVGPVAFP
jgi:hypothetical protein